MKRARVVIGANFGDEGKGLITDYLCSEGAGVVVRFNGGAQAGHTVVTPHGRRHVFSHVGSGAFLGVPTYLSEYFIVNPIFFLKELDTLKKQYDVSPSVYASPSCIVTTFADMIINQRKEEKRGAKRHGSVGLGVHETQTRAQGAPHLTITMGDLWNGRDLTPVLDELCTKYAAFRTGTRIDNPGLMIEAFEKACEITASIIKPAGVATIRDLDPVFEGAQGLLLSQDNTEFFPHVTHSYTGIRNVAILCGKAGIDVIEPYYVSRTYVTRHGAGPLPSEDPSMRFEDDTNLEHPYQGTLRFAPLDAGALHQRIAADCAAVAGCSGARLALTHCDQRAPGAGIVADLYVHGPTRLDVVVNHAKR